jgi:AcrR family transcriptional regulator
VPPPNAARRRTLTDAAIELVARRGLHGLSHRAVDRQAGVPAGTTSNYFGTRDALLVATMERVWELHHLDMESQDPTDGGAVRARAKPDRSSGRAPVEGRRASLADAVELIAASLVEAATTHRERYVAIYEMQSEMRRRPELGQALARLQTRSAKETTAYHAARGLPIPPDVVPSLEILYGGALLSLLSVPVAQVTLDAARPLAHTLIYGATRP